MKEAVAIVEARLEVFRKMKSLFFTLDGHMVPASVNVYHLTEMEIIMHLSKENVTNKGGTGHKGADLCEKCHGYKQLDPLLKN